MTTSEVSERRHRIAEASRLTGFSPTTLRFYENAGVLSPPVRTESGYRLYSDRDVERLRLVSRAKQLGCTLEEITGLVQAWDANRCGPVKHGLRAMVATKVAEVHKHIASQVAFTAQLQATAASLSGRPVDGPCDDTCGCATALTAAEPGADTRGDGCGCAGQAGEAAPVLLVGGRASDDEPPIACSLGAGDMAARVADWQAVLSHVVDRNPVQNGLRLTFGLNPPVAEVARLVEAEVSCCSFFRMQLAFDRHGVALEVTAPAEGRPLLESLFGAHA